MQYALRDLTFDALAPWVAIAKGNERLLSNPFNPLSYTLWGRQLLASNELFVRVAQRYDKQPFGLTETLIDGQPVAVREAIVHARPFCDLVHFARATDRRDPTVLIVAPLSGHHATLLRDTVRTMLPDFDVYLTDWRDAKLVPLDDGPFGLDDYVEYIREFIQLLGPGTSVISVCQPTVPVFAAIALMSEDRDPATPPAMIMMGGPIDTRNSPTVVDTFAEDHSDRWFASKVIETVPASYPGRGRRVYPGHLQWLSFVAMNFERHRKSYFDYYQSIVNGDADKARAHRTFYDEYNAVLDLPAEFYLETVQRVFKEYALARGTFRVRERLVRPETIASTALFTIEGELDDISGIGQTEAAHRLTPLIPADRRAHLLVEKAGHYGIFSGRRYREVVYPQIRDFIRRSL
ncbi:MAG: polyhydroxyalkanoate depolymerase [Vulcanimicrobiaceae bacterium]